MMELIVDNGMYLSVVGNLTDDENIMFTVTDMTNSSNDIYAAFVMRYKESITQGMRKVEDGTFAIEGVPSGTMIKINLCFVDGDCFRSTNSVAVFVGTMQPDTVSGMPQYSPVLAVLNRAFCDVNQTDDTVTFMNASGQPVTNISCKNPLSVYDIDVPKSAQVVGKLSSGGSSLKIWRIPVDVSITDRTAAGSQIELIATKTFDMGGVIIVDSFLRHENSTTSTGNGNFIVAMDVNPTYTTQWTLYITNIQMIESGNIHGFIHMASNADLSDLTLHGLN